MALAREYFELHAKYNKIYGEKNTILLMQVGAFFECYGLYNEEIGEMIGGSSNIDAFCRICDFHKADKHVSIDGKPVFMAGFGIHMIDKYLNKLQQAGMTIVVYVQDEQKSNTTRSLAGIYSPGTFLSSDVGIQTNGQNTLNNHIMCIWVHKHDNRSAFLKRVTKMDGDEWLQIGISNIDIYTGKTYLFEYKENYMSHSLTTCMDEWERYASIYNPSECIVIGNLEEGLLREMASYVGHKMVHVHSIMTETKEQNDVEEKIRKCEKQIYQREILETFYVIKNFNAFYESFLPYTVATQSFCFLLDFVFQHNPSLVKKISDPIFEHTTNRLLLANHSLKQLNILDDAMHDYVGRYSSVEKCLNQCLTPMGRRRFSYQLLHPMIDDTMLTHEYEMMDLFLSSIDRYDEWLPQRLQTYKDIGKINRLVFLKKVTPKQLAFLYQNVCTALDISSRIQEEKGLIHRYCLGIRETIRETNRETIRETKCLVTACNRLKHFLDTRLDIPLCSGIDVCKNFETHIFLKNVDPSLDKLVFQWNEGMDQLNAIATFLSKEIGRLETSGKKKNYSASGSGSTGGSNDYVKIYETEKGFLSLVATKKRTELLKKMEMIDSDEAAAFKIEKTAITFSAQNGNNNAIGSPQIDALCQKCQSLKHEINEKMNEVYNQSILSCLEDYQEELEILIQYITALDVLYTKCAVAKKYHYCLPVIDKNAEQSFFMAEGLRHLLIEQIQKDEVYVVNDFGLGPGGSNMNGVLLYGTNAVGKTSFIRSIGICIVLAQAGMYVPCKSFVYKPYHAIYTRILGNDNLFKGMSSFAVEMMELRAILKNADAYSLVLGDELCSGTESISAKSIFVAGVEKLYHLGASFVFATHLHEIVDYEELEAMKRVKCMHMAVTYDRSIDRLVYNRKLMDGAGSNMYGLEVCKSLHMPEDFLTRANDIRMKYNKESSSLLTIKQSHFNAEKLMGMCELCNGKRGQEVHHIAEQARADEDGYILHEDGTIYHKNVRFNLMSLCETCHKEIHHGGKKNNIAHV